MRATGESQVLWGDEEKSVCADSKEFRHNPLVFPLVSFQRKTCGLHSSLCKLLCSELQTEGSPSVNKMDKAETQNVWEHVSIVAFY